MRRSRFASDRLRRRMAGRPSLVPMPACAPASVSIQPARGDLLATAPSCSRMTRPRTPRACPVSDPVPEELAAPAAVRFLRHSTRPSKESETMSNDEMNDTPRAQAMAVRAATKAAPKAAPAKAPAKAAAPTKAAKAAPKSVAKAPAKAAPAKAAPAKAAKPAPKAAAKPAAKAAPAVQGGSEAEGRCCKARPEAGGGTQGRSEARPEEGCSQAGCEQDRSVQDDADRQVSGGPVRRRQGAELHTEDPPPQGRCHARADHQQHQRFDQLGPRPRLSGAGSRPCHPSPARRERATPLKGGV